MAPTHICQMASYQEPKVQNYCKKTTHWGGHLLKAENTDKIRTWMIEPIQGCQQNKTH